MRSNLLWIGLLAAVVIVWMLTTVIVRPHSGEQTVRSTRVRTASLKGECVECHTRSSPGIVNQHGLSAHAAAGVTCRDCHGVGEEHFAAMDHYEVTITGSPTSAQCEAWWSIPVAAR